MDAELSFVFSRPETTDAVTRGAARLLVALGYAPLAEVSLPNGRRADLMALGPRGDIAIAADDLFEGPMATALAPDACLTEVHFPTWSHARAGAARSSAPLRPGKRPAPPRAPPLV